MIRKNNFFLNDTTASCSKYLSTSTMFFFLFVWLLGIYSAHAILSVTPLSDCPNISPQSGFKIEQVAGTWRLAYLLIDENSDLEEDNTCAVTEIMQVNETQLEMLLYVDGRKDEFTIDRYTKEFDITVLTPNEWLFHTSFADLEFIHVTVIGYSANHLILTFCIDPFTPDGTPIPNTESANDYDSFLNVIDRDNMNDVLKAQNYNRLFSGMDDLTGKLSRQRRVRRPHSRLFRGKRYARNFEENFDESRYDKIMNFLKKTKSAGNPKKHLWTVILVKDNNTSALRFIENASMLMKYGFKIKEGQLVSFGSCSLYKK